MPSCLLRIPFPCKLISNSRSPSNSDASTSISAPPPVFPPVTKPLPLRRSNSAIKPPLRTSSNISMPTPPQTSDPDDTPPSPSENTDNPPPVTITPQTKMRKLLVTSTEAIVEDSDASSTPVPTPLTPTSLPPSPSLADPDTNHSPTQNIPYVDTAYGVCPGDGKKNRTAQ